MSIYREYDIRGIVPEELSPERVFKIGYALSRRIDGRYVAVGHDARTHSRTLFEALSLGLAAGGKTILDMGMVPTPVNYFCNYQRIADLTDALPNVGERPAASVMITGSHNPPEYNGFKITVDRAPFFSDAIYRLGEEVEEMPLPPDWQEGPPEIVPIRAVERYIEYMVDAFRHLRGMPTRIVYDGGNGVAGVVLPEIFEMLELDARGLYVEPDGTFPNHHPDPAEEENLADVKAALAEGGDIAFAYDGDADRIAVLTHRHNIKGDQMALLFAMTMETPTVIGEVKCSQVMYDELERRGAKTIMYKTGHSNLKVKIRETGANLACEVSGHIFFNDRYFGYDDAIYATLRILELLHQGVDLDAEIERLPRTYATEEIKVPTTEARKFAVIEAIREVLQNPPEGFPPIRELIEVDGLRIVFDEGWALVRASNTTPVLVTRYEALSGEMCDWYRRSVEKIITKINEGI